MPSKKHPQIDQQIAMYGPFFRLQSTDRDVFITFMQPVDEKNVISVAKIAMPMQSAEELATLLTKQISNHAK